MARDKRNHGAVVEIVDGEGAVLVKVSGVIDERFAGFGAVDASKSIVIDVTNMARMTSFGIRQWLNALDTLPSRAGRNLIGCPTFFVDQLNMVLNFGGACVVTVQAPYRCPACGTASSETVDVLAHRAM